MARHESLKPKGTAARKVAATPAATAALAGAGCAPEQKSSNAPPSAISESSPPPVDLSARKLETKRDQTDTIVRRTLDKFAEKMVEAQDRGDSTVLVENIVDDDRKTSTRYVHMVPNNEGTFGRVIAYSTEGNPIHYLSYVEAGFNDANAGYSINTPPPADWDNDIPKPFTLIHNNLGTTLHDANKGMVYTTADLGAISSQRSSEANTADAPHLYQLPDRAFYQIDDGLEGSNVVRDYADHLANQIVPNE